LVVGLSFSYIYFLSTKPFAAANGGKIDTAFLVCHIPLFCSTLCTVNAQNELLESILNGSFFGNRLWQNTRYQKY